MHVCEYFEAYCLLKLFVVSYMVLRLFLLFFKGCYCDIHMPVTLVNKVFFFFNLAKVCSVLFIVVGFYYVFVLVSAVVGNQTLLHFMKTVN